MTDSYKCNSKTLAWLAPDIQCLGALVIFTETYSNWIRGNFKIGEMSSILHSQRSWTSIVHVKSS